jgi:hypothetical protein
VDPAAFREKRPSPGVSRLPDFIIVGAMKSGTSSLNSALRVHPEVFCPNEEQHFFCERFDKGVEWYRQQFRDGGDAKLIGEKSADYLYQAVAVERMARLLPDARVIVMLRNPVDRAYSHYWHARRYKSEQLSFADALDVEPDRVRAGDGWRAYVDMGRYTPQLERLASLYPRSSIHVVLFEDFKSDPLATFAGVCRFLNVDDTRRPPILRRAVNPYRRTRFPRTFQHVKKTHLFQRLPRGARKRIYRVFDQPSEYPPLEHEIRDRLNEVFEPENEKLAAWLSLDHSLWRS